MLVQKICESCGEYFEPENNSQTICWFCEMLPKTAMVWVEGADVMTSAYKNGPLGSMGSLPRDGEHRQLQQVRVGRPHNRSYRYRPRVCPECGESYKLPGKATMCKKCRLKVTSSDVYKNKIRASGTEARHKLYAKLYGPNWKPGETWCIYCSKKIKITNMGPNICEACRAEYASLAKYREFIKRVKKQAKLGIIYGRYSGEMPNTWQIKKFKLDTRKSVLIKYDLLK